MTLEEENAKLREEIRQLKISLAEAKDDFEEITNALSKQGLVWDDELFMYVDNDDK